MTTTKEHVATTLVWKGLGVNEAYSENFDRSAMMECLHPTWIRLALTITDPGASAMAYDDTTMDSLWEEYAARISSSGMTSSVPPESVLLYGGDVPRSWLSLARELRGDALVAYAKLLTSAVVVFRRANIAVTWLEVCEEPDRCERGGSPLLTPENYVMLSRVFRAQLARRSVLTVKLMGPTLSRVLSTSEYTEPYVAAFARQQPLDAWSIHVAEAESDKCCYNAGSYAARNYIYREMARSLLFMRFVSPDIPVLVTKLSTQATRFSTGINYGRGAPETVEHALRLIESICNVVAAGATVVLPWNTCETRRHGHSHLDNRCLLRRDGAHRPHCDAMAHVNATLPVDGLIYEASGAVAPGDETLTLVVVLRNSFGFILGRAHKEDSNNGQYTLKIQNDDWKATQCEATLTLHAFPSYVSLTGTDKTVSVDAAGTLTVVFKELPYNCVVFARGDVYTV